MRASWKVMNSKIEQCIVIKVLIDSGEKPAKIFLKYKKVFRNECVSRTHIFEQARRFKEGRRSVYDDQRPSAPVTVTTNENVNRLRALLTTDHRLTTRMLSVELGLTMRPSISCFTTSYTCKNCAQNSFRMHWHIHLSQYANISHSTLEHNVTTGKMQDF